MRALLALLLLGLLAGCSTPENAPGASPDAFGAGRPVESDDAIPGATGVAYQFQTTIGEAGFEHPRLDSATQATIVWKNLDVQTHSVVSDDGTFAGSGPIAPGSGFSFTFQTPGDYAYHCRYHDGMTGLVVVR